MTSLLTPRWAAVGLIVVIAAGGLAYGADDGSPPNVVKVLRTTDKAQSNTYVPKVFTVKYANPHEVSKFLEDSVMAESGLIATYANPDDDGQSGLILVVVPEYQLAKIGETVRELDRAELTNISGTRHSFVNVKHRSVTNDHLSVTSPEILGGTTDFVESLLVYGGPDTSIDVDVRTNSLMVTGAPSAVSAVEAALIDYDVPRDQIQIAVKVYEVESNNDATLGLDFLAWKNGPGQDLFQYSRRHLNLDINGVQEHFRQRSRGYNVEYSTEFFDFLAVKGKARVVNELRGAVINGFAAEFNVFDDILALPGSEGGNARDSGEARYTAVERLLWVLSRQKIQGTDQVITMRVNEPKSGPFDKPVVPPAQALPDETAVEGVEVPDRKVGSRLVARDTGSQQGLFLKVRPLISRGNIDLDVEARVESFLSFDDSGTPQISDRLIRTRVRASNGETVVLGGMKRSREIKTTRKIPVLGSIPVLGYLFGGEITGVNQLTVFVVITPTIIEQGAIRPEDRETMVQAEGGELQLPGDTLFFDQYILGR